MDLYHQVLHKLNEVSGGKDSKAVDFKDLVKKMGFNAHYSNIFEHLSGEGWIIETPKADFVSLTHWGISEVKKSAPVSTATPEQEEMRREVAKTISTAKELTALLEKFSSALSKEDFARVEQKTTELQNLLTQTKNKLSQ